MTELVKYYQTFAATCNLQANIDWLGNYKINKITNQELKYLGEARNIEQYMKRLVEVIKDNVLKNVSDINTVKWNIKGFDENISLHFLVREVSKILDKFMKKKLIQKYPYIANNINKSYIDFNKSLVIEITNNNKIIFLANISIQSFL